MTLHDFVYKRFGDLMKQFIATFAETPSTPDPSLPLTLSPTSDTVPEPLATQTSTLTPVLAAKKPPSIWAL